MQRDWKKERLKENIGWYKSDIEFYSELKRQMQKRKSESKNEKNVEILSEIIKNCTKEIRKARKELRTLL